MLLAGKGDSEKWYSILGPSLVQEIKERVDIDLRPDNARITPVGDPIKLTADVKNVQQLLIKIFEVNTLNFYTKEGREIDTGVNLDGLIPNVERSFEYADAPMRSIRRTFDFPELKGKRGVWVVELIGGGKSSRALIRKGGLQTLTEVNALGHVIKLLDENNQRVQKGAVWLNGKSHDTNEDGIIVLPFSNSPGNRTLVLESGGFAALGRLNHHSENYQLHAGFFVDREQLLSRNRAMVVVRPSLTVSGVPTGIDVLNNVVLEIQTQTLDGISTTDRVEDFELFGDRESTYFFAVPDRLAKIQFRLTAKADRPSQGDKVDLAVADNVVVNQINQSQYTRAIYLTRFENNWVVEVLGKNGEPIVDIPLNCYFQHKEFTFERHASLETDANGRATLGPLADISQVRIETPTAVARSWPLLDERRTWTSVVTAKAGDPVRIPYPGNEAQPKPEEIALFEVRGNSLRENTFAKVAIADRQLTLTGLEAGNHQLLLRKLGRVLRIRVVAGEIREKYVLGRDRHVQTAPLKPTTIVSTQSDGDDLLIRLANANSLTRVHVFADRFYPEIDAHDKLGSFPRLGPGQIRRGKGANSYVSGRTLGEEHRYIIERRDSPRYPGNQLERAGLILNPWELRDTNTQIDQAAAGDEYEAKADAEMAAAADGQAEGGQGSAQTGSHPDLDFIATGSIALANLRPIENGVLRVPLKNLDDRQWIRIVVTDPTQAVSTDVFLGDAETGFQDIRLAAALDPEKAFAQKKNTTVLGEGDVLELGTTDFRIISTPKDIHPILVSLTNEQLLGEFAFILGWNQLEPEEKRTQYSKHASHELNFYISRRDPQFFNAVIKLYLANKRDKTFVDDYLLGKNLENYLQMFEFGRLNTTEKLLMARRLGGENEARIERHVVDANALLLPNPSLDDSLFETALRSRALSGDVIGDLLDLLGRADLNGDDVVALNSALTRNGQAKELGRRGGVVRASVAYSDSLVALDAPMAAAEAAPGEQRLQEAGKKMRGLDRAKYREEKQLEGMIAEGKENAGFGFVSGGVELPLDGNGLYELGKDGLGVRAELRQLYRKLDSTKVWAENNYYHVPIEYQIASLITVNKFWRDYAAWDGEGAFFSPHFTHATSNLSEMIYALALLDLPEESGEHKIEVDNGVIKITAASPCIIFHQEIEPAEQAEGQQLLVSQNFFDPQNRYLEENGQRT
ncbi:MAG: hypothetical protein ACI8UO_006763, partial [Verrucomicrobiales bacterium]